MLGKIKTSYRKFLKNTSGVAAVEFALVLPFMAVIYFGAIETSFLVQSDRRVNNAASTMADLVSRVDVATFNDVEDVFLATANIVRPNDVDGLEMRLTSIVDVDGKAVVDWSQGRNVAALPAGQTVDVPDGVLPAGSSVIVAEVNFDFESSLGYFIPSAKELSDRFFLRPRQVDAIEWVGDETGATNADWTPSTGGTDGGDAAQDLWDDGDDDTNPEHAGGWYDDDDRGDWVGGDDSGDDDDTGTGEDTGDNGNGGNDNCDGYGNCGVGQGGGGGNGTDNEGNGQGSDNNNGNGGNSGNSGNTAPLTEPVKPAAPDALGMSKNIIADYYEAGLSDGSLDADDLVEEWEALADFGFISDDELTEISDWIQDLADYVEDLAAWEESQNGSGDDDDDDVSEENNGGSDDTDYYPEGQKDSPIDHDQGGGNDSKLADYVGQDAVEKLEKAVFAARDGDLSGAEDPEVLEILATFQALELTEPSLKLDTSDDQGMGVLISAVEGSLSDGLTGQQLNNLNKTTREAIKQAMYDLPEYQSSNKKNKLKNAANKLGAAIEFHYKDNSTKFDQKMAEAQNLFNQAGLQLDVNVTIHPDGSASASVSVSSESTSTLSFHMAVELT